MRTTGREICKRVLILVLVLVTITFCIHLIVKSLKGEPEPITCTKSVYFHYTDHDSIKQILKSKFIKESTDTARDAAFGKGVYVTKLSPTLFTKEMIASNNYTTKLGHHKMLEGKVDTCIELLLEDKDVQDVSEKGRNIYLYPGNLNLAGVKCIVHNVS